MRRLLAALAMTVLLARAVPAAEPMPAAEPLPAREASAAPASVAAFVDLLDDPGVRGWLHAQLAARDAAPVPAAPTREPTLQERLAANVAELRARAGTLLAALPALPGELRAAFGRIAAELAGAGLGWALGVVLAFAAAGYLCQVGFVRASRRLRHGLLGAAPATPGARLGIVALRLLLALLSVAAFAVGSIGAFTVLPWPPVLKQVVLTALAGIVLIRGAWILVSLAAAPRHPERRLLPLDDGCAAFLQRWLRLLSALAIGAWLLVQLLLTLGVAEAAADLVGAATGLVLLALTLAMAWAAVPHIRAYRADHAAIERAAATWGMDDFLPILLSVALPLAWLLWGLGAGRAAATLVLLLALPAALWTWRQLVEHVAGPAQQPAGAVGVMAARVGRSLIVLLAALLLLRIWGVDLLGLAGQESAGGRLLAGLVKTVLLLAVADIGLQLLRLAFDRWMAADLGEAPAADQAGRRDRLRTLLPIVRNVVLIVVGIMAGLTVLASFGVEIGPLLAGAGVVGLAIGFGAQTLVKDIIAGFFFLLDDAFRVGEYIESGSYKGTVESFSLRSIKLRHQRGPLYTVPFGSLGAVVNHSRDWVIDRLYLNVTYDTDLDRVKAIVKAIGKTLAADPAFAGDVLQPLKLQGVDQMGEYAIKLRLKMMTKPGRQFLMRRRAYALIKQAFATEGISFAVPTVQVREGGEPAAAAAARLMDGPRTGAA
ncbi:MAG: mechanosensitive ion channel family protein [Geminicoccaceae bacterium]